MTREQAVAAALKQDPKAQLVRTVQRGKVYEFCTGWGTPTFTVTAPARQTMAQQGRQNRAGAEWPVRQLIKCYGGCGRGVNVEGGNWMSHPRMDEPGTDGENFGDVAHVLCPQCGARAQDPDLQTVTAWKAFVLANNGTGRTHGR